MDQPLFLDFEASCLPCDGRSFPIEVALADGHGYVRSWLIRPAPQWADWRWTEEAERLHGISRARIAREGEEAATVMAALNALCAGRAVYADHDFDRRWLATLAEAAGVPAAFRLHHISEWIDPRQPSDSALLSALAVADRKIAHRHRAAWDAQWLAALALALDAPQVSDIPVEIDTPRRQAAWTSRAR